MFQRTACVSLLSVLALLPCLLAQDTPDIAEPETIPTDFTPIHDECREEQYPCTRLYSIHHPLKQCLHKMCFYSLRRMYVVNKEICLRTVCEDEERIKADLCRKMKGWPTRVRRTNQRRNRLQC